MFIFIALFLFLSIKHFYFLFVTNQYFNILTEVIERGWVYIGEELEFRL